MEYEISVTGKKARAKLVEGDACDILHVAALELGYAGSLHVQLVNETGECRGYTDDGWAKARRQLPLETDNPEEQPKFTYDDPDGKLALVVAVPVK
jgi:hypothetical protein